MDEVRTELKGDIAYFWSVYENSMFLISKDVRVLREVAEMHNEVLGADLPWLPYSRTPSVQKSRTPVICKFS